MGLQKGQSGYAFRWLVPIFSLISSLLLLINAIVCTIVASGSSYLSSLGGLSDIIDGIADEGLSFIGNIGNSILTTLKIYAVSVWMIALIMLALAIVGFVMNKKGSYLFGVIGGALAGLTYFIKFCFCLYIHSKVKEFMPNTFIKAGLYMFFIFAFAICVCIFSAVALTKCSYEKTMNERNIVGENLTYVGFENDPSTVMSNYHQPGVQGRIDPYAPPAPPTPAPEINIKPERYVPKGPVGKITCTAGMYRGVSFDISDNEEITIGRDPRIAQIVIGEGAQNVSREHCRISYSASENTYSIIDMSKNGTFSKANRSKLPHKVYTKVPVGTEIYLGDKNNMFRLG